MGALPTVQNPSREFYQIFRSLPSGTQADRVLVNILQELLFCLEFYPCGCSAVNTDMDFYPIAFELVSNFPNISGTLQLDCVMEVAPDQAGYLFLCRT